MAQFVPSARKYFLQPPKMGPQNWTPKLGPKIGPRRLIAGLEPTAKRRGKWWRVDQLFRLPKGHRRAQTHGKRQGKWWRVEQLFRLPKGHLRAQTHGKTTGEMVASRPTFLVAERSSPGSNPRQNDGGNGGESTNFSGCRKVIAGLKPTARRRCQR